jgi:tRNA dimethylallyltransferase
MQGIHATNQLAKRQLTWLRSMRDATLIDPDAADAADALDALRRALD